MRAASRTKPAHCHPPQGQQFPCIGEMLRKVALRGAVVGGVAYAGYSFLKPVETQVDFSGGTKKARVRGRHRTRGEGEKHRPSSHALADCPKFVC